jgi:hypothetical protein
MYYVSLFQLCDFEHAFYKGSICKEWWAMLAFCTAGWYAAVTFHGSAATHRIASRVCSCASSLATDEDYKGDDAVDWISKLPLSLSETAWWASSPQDA